ncbi:thiamine-binding protein [Campylobacter sp. MIT 97-5078]|uniref:thiamine-binding protein n=1 Tax=Campylobacter sp. MIT 97-5078 TaxID=1548153 RepID=UPI00055490FF|nr:thiamine-binding protein [Campylobacter sp. MIT 97-5078]TQR26988.1 hypothetical protein DMB91_05335 [Campylobacter sp. MIT 97-5078]
MSVLMEFCIFSISGKLSKSAEVAKVIRKLESKNIAYKLNPMGTCVECKSMKKALKVLKMASNCFDSKRFYITAKFDCYEARKEAFESKVRAVKEKL